MSDRPEPANASCGVTVSRTSGFVDPRGFDYIVVVGGLLHGRRQVDDATIDYLHKAARAGVKLIGICTGVFVLCRAGLMQDYTSCISWYHSRDFEENFPDHAVVTDRMFLVDRDRITCAGGVGAADLAACLIEQRLGHSIAQKASHVLLLGRMQRDEASLQPHPPLQGGYDDVQDSRVRRALLLMEQNLASPVSIAAIARELHISPRQLERLFQFALGVRPGAHYRQLRLRHGRWLLTNADMSVTTIAIETGFSDCAHFSRQFKMVFGHSPTEARNARLIEKPPSAETSHVSSGRGPTATPFWSERAGVRLFGDL